MLAQCRVWLWVAWFGCFIAVYPLRNGFVSGRVINECAGAVEIRRPAGVYDLAGHETALWHRASGYRPLDSGETFKLTHLPIEPFPQFPHVRAPLQLSLRRRDN